MSTIKLNLPTIEHMRSSSGREVPNQLTIRMEGGIAFQSYGTNIAYREISSGKVYLDETYWNYSTTTGKYRNQFLRETIKETRKRIESGEYILADLNA